MRLLDEIVDRGAPQLSSRTKDVLSALFNFAVDRDPREKNPIADDLIAVDLRGSARPTRIVMSPDDMSIQG